MKFSLEELNKQKLHLKECIKISEIGNDSYYLSPLYKEHQSLLFTLNKQIEQCEKNEKLSTDKTF